MASNVRKKRASADSGGCLLHLDFGIRRVWPPTILPVSSPFVFIISSGVEQYFFARVQRLSPGDEFITTRDGRFDHAPAGTSLW
jgi:hypothetical protein